MRVAECRRAFTYNMNNHIYTHYYSVDRLDYIKGVPQKLFALDVFLEKYPEWQGKVVLVQVAVPSRTDVEEYIQLRTTVNELVGRINGKYGKSTCAVIRYRFI